MRPLIKVRNCSDHGIAHVTLHCLNQMYQPYGQLESSDRRLMEPIISLTKGAVPPVL